MNISITHVDSKWRVVIPKRVREHAGFSREEGLIAFAFEGMVLLQSARHIDLEPFRFPERARNAKSVSIKLATGEGTGPSGDHIKERR